MALTLQQLVARAGAMARRGQAESESGVWDHNIWRLVPDALKALALEVAADAVRRNTLIASFPLTLVDGICNLATPTYDTLLREWLPNARLYDIEDAGQLHPFVYKANPGEMKGWLNPNCGYWSVDRDFLITRKRNVEDVAAALTGTTGAIIHASYIPTTQVPTPLEDRAIALLAGLAVAPVAEIVG